MPSRSWLQLREGFPRPTRGLDGDDPHRQKSFHCRAIRRNVGRRTACRLTSGTGSAATAFNSQIRVAGPAAGLEVKHGGGCLRDLPWHLCGVFLARAWRARNHRDEAYLAGRNRAQKLDSFKNAGPNGPARPLPPVWSIKPFAPPALPRCSARAFPASRIGQARSTPLVRRLGRSVHRRGCPSPRKLPW